MSEELTFILEVEALAQRAPQVLYRQPVEEEEAARVQTFVDSRTDADGVLTVPRSSIDEYRAEVRAALQRRAGGFIAELETAATAAAEALTVAEQVHAELPTEAQRVGPEATDQVRLLARQVDVQEEAAAVRRLTGRTFAQIARLYEEATDSGHGALVRVIETAVRDGFHGLDVVRGGADDAFVLTRLGKLVTTRRAARLPAWVTDGRTRLAKALPPTLKSHAEIIKGGVPVVKG